MIALHRHAMCAFYATLFAMLALLRMFQPTGHVMQASSALGEVTFQLDTFMFSLSTRTWQCALPREGRYPQGAFHARLDTLPSGQLQLSSYALIEDASCGGLNVQLLPQILPVLEVYAIRDVDFEAGIVTFVPLALYQAATGSQEKWQQLCDSQWPANKSRCECTSGSLLLGRRQAKASLFEWSLKQPVRYGNNDGAKQPCHDP
jgi:hypothetical protein